MEIVRRALNPDSEHEYYRKQVEELNRIMGSYQQQIEYEAAQLTEETEEELSRRINDDLRSVPNSEGYEAAVHRATMRDVLSLYQRTRNTREGE